MYLLLKCFSVGMVAEEQFHIYEILLGEFCLNCLFLNAFDGKFSHHVDIRFFGQHDKAWLSVTHVTMHTSEDPYTRPGCPKVKTAL